MSKRFAKPIILLSALLFVVGCNISVPKMFGGATEIEQYMLTDDQPKKEVSYAHRQAALRLHDQTSSRMINSPRILFREDSNEIKAYQFSRWADLPPKRFISLLLKRLDAVDIFSSVSRSSSAIRSDYQLNLELTELYHDTENRPGRSHMELRAELIDLGNRRMIAKKTIHHSQPVYSYSALGAVESMSKVSSEVLDDLVAWLDKVTGGEEATSG